MKCVGRLPAAVRCTHIACLVIRNVIGCLFRVLCSAAFAVRCYRLLALSCPSVRPSLSPHASAPTGLIFVKFDAGVFMKDLSAKSGFG